MADVRKKNLLKAKRYLVKQIEQLVIGDNLPSIRSMVSESGIGRRTLEAALETMLNQGYIETRNRRGIYKAAELPRKSDKLVVDIICCSEAGYLHSPNSFFSTLRDKLCFEATSNNYLIRMHQIKEDASLSSYDRLILENNINFAFLLAPHTIEIEKVFANFHVDTVTVLPRYQKTYSYAVVDSPNMVDIQMNHLFNLGHKRIAFIGDSQNEYFNPVFIGRTLNYYRIMAENGYKVYPHWVIQCDYNNDVLAEKISIMFSEEPMPTAVICCDLALTVLYNFLVFKKLKIGKDVSIISCDNLEHLRLFPMPTTIINSREMIAKMAWTMFENIISNQEVVKVQHPQLTLKIKESTSPVINKGDVELETFAKIT